MYVILRNSTQVMKLATREAALGVLDHIKEAALKSGEDATYYSFIGKDIRLVVTTATEEITYIFREEKNDLS